MKVLYVSDLDGTLLTKEERISDYSIGILNRLIENGMYFTYATARSYQTAKTATRGLYAGFPVITYNGALVINPSTGEVIHHASFEEEVKGSILSVLKSLDIHPFVYSWDGEKEKLSWVEGRETQAMNRYLSRRRNDERLSPCDRTEDLINGDVFYFNCMGEADKMLRAYDVFSKDPRLSCLIHRETYQSDYWLEIFSSGATKEVAVRKLKERYGFDKVVCFGDSVNDIPMFRMADEKYAVMNADDVLKENASGVIGYCEEDGVAKWLDSYSGF